MVKAPLASVTVRDSAAVALFFATTSAPGMTPPDESTTRPESEVVLPPP